MEPLIPSASQTGATIPTTARSSFLASLTASAALGLAVLCAYFPALTGTLLWDDDQHLTPPELRSVSGLGRIWTDLGATQQYYPLLHSLFWIQYRLWGDSPLGYHLVSVLLHTLGALLLIGVLREMGRTGAWLAAAVFALHPVHVESVAWISEQKNTLSLVFYLGAAWAYLRYDHHRTPGMYRLALTLYLLGLASKTVVCTLPVTLLVVVWWRRGRIELQRDVRPLLPWLLLGFAFGVLTIAVERHFIGAGASTYDLTPLQRLLLAPRIVVFYAGHLVWPAGLMFIYPRWVIDPTELSTWIPLLVVIAAGTLSLRSRTRTPLALGLLFAIPLFPALGLFTVYPFRYSYVADHFQYLASPPMMALAGAALVRLPGLVRPVTSFLLVTGLAVLTWQQAGAYRDTQTLYRHTLARNPACWMAYNNLGRELLQNPETKQEAIACFQSAIALFPDYWEARNNLGLALAQSASPETGLPHLQAAIALKPISAESHNNLGIALARSGRAAEALVAFRRAAELAPDQPKIYENWARALRLLGRDRESDSLFELARRMRQSPGP
ncbi:MAG: tetratricopeptide repeat protein [Opitutaceae bacterium]|nr:tetratricopeptide repeat protein [Opitutaceae bacterium]